MKADKVKQAIVKKFAKLSRFAEISGLDYYKLQKTLANKSTKKSELVELYELVKSTEQTETVDELSEYQKNELRKRLDDYGGVDKFSRENEYSRDSIFQILNGRRKRITPKVVVLFNILKIKI